MTYVTVNPRYRETLQRSGLADAERFLDLPGVIYSGHPDRHVARVTLVDGNATLHAFLKREHRVRWWDRVLNLWHGFGPVSKSRREASLLATLGDGCAPELIASGEDRSGRAFLLTRGLDGFVDLRRFLRANPDATGRRQLAMQLGGLLARLHGDGYVHADLFAKHILIGPDGATVRLLDWQRSRRSNSPSLVRRCRDLAALDATLAEDLVSGRDRLRCLRAYLQFAPVQDRTTFRHMIVKQTQRLLGRRQIREQHHDPLPAGEQNLLWIKGEELCVTAAFWDRLGRRTPEWLTPWGVGGFPHNVRAWTPIELPGGGRGVLARRFSRQPCRRLWNWLRSKQHRSPELAEAGVLFRLQRHGIATPQILAVGQRFESFGRCESFLLTEASEGINLTEWLAGQAQRRLTPAELSERRSLVREAAVLLRAVHQAGCHGQQLNACMWSVRQTEDGVTLFLGSVDGLRTRRRISRATVRASLQSLRDSLASIPFSRTDEVRFLRHYFGENRLGAGAKELYRSLRRLDKSGHGYASAVPWRLRLTALTWGWRTGIKQ